MCAVWQSMTGVYPARISPGWFRIMTWALKLSAPLAGSFLLSEQTLPRRTSFTDTFFTLKPTLSPGRASGRDSWCISTDLTSVVTIGGAKVTTMAGFVRRPRWGKNGIHGLEQSRTLGVSFLALDLPALEPRHVAGLLEHVVSVPARNGYERHRLGVVANLLDVLLDLTLDFLEASLAVGWRGAVHLIDSDNHLFHAKCVSKQYR